MPRVIENNIYELPARNKLPNVRALLDHDGYMRHGNNHTLSFLVGARLYCVTTVQLFRGR